jgi:hypothetical protein
LGKVLAVLSRLKLSVLSVIGRLRPLVRRKHLIFVAVQLACIVAGAYLFKRLPAPGVAGVIIAVIAVFMSFHSEAEPAHKAVWMVIVGVFLVVEIQAIRHDRAVTDAKQEQVLKEQRTEFALIGKEIESNINEGRTHFEATVRRLEPIMETTAETLAQTNSTLSQSLGGKGSPYFLATYPSNPQEKEWPVTVWYSDKLPAVDVTVDIMLRPAKGQVMNGETIASVNHPQHFNLGTITSNMFTAPFRLQPGKRYYLTIVTRRGWFYEKINIDADPSAANGWRVSECLYRNRDQKLLQGKCEN